MLYATFKTQVLLAVCEITKFCGKSIDKKNENDYDDTISDEKDTGTGNHMQREGGRCKPFGRYLFLLPWNCP